MSGCVDSRVKSEVVYIRPPENLLVPTPRPMYEGETFQDALEYIEIVWSAQDKCNADKKSIKKFIEESDNE